MEMHESGVPVFATGGRATRMSALFRRWVGDSFTQADWAEATALGIAPERLMAPPPERICPIGSG